MSDFLYFKFLSTGEWRPKKNQRVKDRESETLQVFHWLFDKGNALDVTDTYLLYYIMHFMITPTAGWVNYRHGRNSILIVFFFVFLCVRRVAWKHRCQGNTDSYIADCNTNSSDDGSSSSPSLANDSSGADRERKPQLAAQPENPQQPNNWPWFPFSHAFPTGWLFFWAQQNRKKKKINKK